MALNFPANPQDGDEYGKYVYNAAKNVWSSSATPPRYLVSQNVPGTANNGDVWFNTSTARSYIYYEDSDSSQWVEIGGAEGAVGTPSELGDIPGVDLTGLADGKTLVYDAANSEWIPGEAGGKFTVSDTAPSEAENGDTWFKSDDGKTYIYYVDADGGQWVEIASNTTGYLDIGQLNDVSIVSPTTGQALTFNGTNWVNATPASTLDSLTDVDTAGVADGQALVYDSANSEWVPGSAAPSGVNIIDSDTINVDFSDNVPLETRAVAGDVTFTASNYTAGAKKTIYLEGDTVSRNLTFPAAWNFITDKPTAIGASKNNILDLNSFGTSESTTVALWLGASSFEPITASGGTESEIIISGVTYKFHKFTSSGLLNISGLGDDGSVDYLIVAGGGGGGAGGSGAAGGGAGGMLTASSFSITTGQHNILIGSGGAPVSSGSNSSFYGFTAIGGGHGGSQNGPNGAPGGSGGGAPGGGGSGTAGTGYGSGTSGQGSRGGTGWFESTKDGGGGGGGASQIGGAGSSNLGGNGADGLAWIDGVTYAGGGGGSSYTGSISSGGSGGGGAGGLGGPTLVAGINGTDGLGGGGGAGNATNGGSYGGSGVVTIAYPITDPN